MALKPGESTDLTLSFMMHQGMDGKHDFRVHVLSTDPTQKDVELTVLSNWIP